jgi:hypothetical protein
MKGGFHISVKKNMTEKWNEIKVSHYPDVYSSHIVVPIIATRDGG